jgi:hypothetical protein
MGAVVPCEGESHEIGEFVFHPEGGPAGFAFFEVAEDGQGMLRRQSTQGELLEQLLDGVLILHVVPC